MGRSFFCNERKIILDNIWVRQYVTSTLDYTNIQIFIYIVSTLWIASGLKIKPIWRFAVWMTAQANTRQKAWEQMPNERQPTFMLAKLRNFFFLVSSFFFFLPPKNEEDLSKNYSF
jgi:hypothetical protein